MRHIKRILPICLLYAIFFTGCKDEDVNPVKEVDKPAYTHIFTSEYDMITTIDSIYGILRRGENVERIELYPIVASGDAMTGGEPGGSDQPSLKEFMLFQSTSDNYYLISYWRSMYEGIAKTNKYIVNANASKDSAGVTENIRLRTIGEAYFLKALFYYKLTLMFGGFPNINTGEGVPIIETIFKPDSILVKRSPLDSTWFKIADYLKTSIDLLPERSQYSETNYGRASKGAAKSLLAKVYVFCDKWQEAYQYASEVINSGEYYLEGDNAHPGPYIVTRLTKEGNVNVKMPGYKWIWQPEANNCGESVFYVQHYADHSTRFPEGQMGNLLPQYYGVRNVWTYNNLGRLTTTNLTWGFILPTEYFVKTAYKDIGCQSEEGDILDPRFKLTVITDKDSVPYYYTDATLRANYPDSVLVDMWYNWPCTGYSTWKYFTDPVFYKERTSLGDYPQSTKFLRYSDVLLIGAEAALQIGQNANALSWINLVRERARNSGNTGYPLPLGSVTLEDIYAERRVELAFEGHQFYDMVRTGRAEKLLKQDAMVYQIVTHPVNLNTTYQEFGDNYIPGKSEILPIPQVVINMANGVIVQNPGY